MGLRREVSEGKTDRSERTRTILVAHFPERDNDGLAALRRTQRVRACRGRVAREEAGSRLGGAQVAEDRGLDPPPSLEEQARMASALATPRLPGTTAGPV